MFRKLLIKGAAASAASSPSFSPTLPAAHTHTGHIAAARLRRAACSPSPAPHRRTPCRVPVGAVFPPKKKSWGAPRGVSARARGARGALCARPWPRPAAGTRRDGWEPGHGDGDAGSVLSVASRGMVALPRATPWGPRTGPPPVPHCLHPLTRCHSQPGRSTSHPLCPAVGDVPRIHPGGATITPLQLGPPQQGAGNGGRQVPGGSGSGRTALPALGPLHILPAMPSGARCLPTALPLFLFVVAQALCTGAARPVSFLFSAPTPLQRPRCSPPIAPGTVAQMPSPLAWPAALQTRPPRVL